MEVLIEEGALWQTKLLERIEKGEVKQVLGGSVKLFDKTPTPRRAKDVVCPHL